MAAIVPVNRAAMQARAHLMSAKPDVAVSKRVLSGAGGSR